ncbi:MAG: hypothetical protein LJE70_00460 [Chromatiaceae bacterium]|jgi:hypothetical protein|nr:hypothetical protein [Chromatiaceae bacterium]
MLPPVDIAYITDELRKCSRGLVEAFEDRNGDADPDPQVLLKALDDLFERLRLLEDAAPGHLSLDGDNPPTLKSIGTLGDHGIDLLARLAVLAGSLLSPQRVRDIEELALPFACWIARRGGELGYLEPVVNGAANLANRLVRPSELGQLYGLLTEVVNAVDPPIPQEAVSADPTHPWRVLLINRAIVATRSHQPVLMEEAFESIVENLPDEAARFFREGMEQMDALNYPPQVREVMRRFHEKWCGQRVLH